MALKLLKFAILALLVGVVSTADGMDPTEFEAAFQGKCGRASPCSQLCRELHDGTYECGCRPGHVLHVDGYSCQEMNGTSKMLADNYIDSEEDVLYQKDASFSAELDIAMVPAKDSENVTSNARDLYTTPENTFATVSTKKNQGVDFDEDVFDLVHDAYLSEQKASNGKTKTKGTPLYSRKEVDSYYVTERAQKPDEGENRGVLLQPFIETDENERKIDDPYHYKLYKEIEGLKSLKANGLTTKDINMIASAAVDGAENRKHPEDDDNLVTTTLGPSLEQKVPPMSTSDPGHTVSSLHSGCPLGKTGLNCDQAAPPAQVPRFSGASYLALPALRGAYKRVRMRLDFKPEARDGLLLLSGERADLQGDYLALLLYRGHVELVFDCGSGAGVVRSDTAVVLNQWNTLTLYRRRWDAWIQLNGGRHVQGRSKGLFSRMTFLDPVFIGGAGNFTGLSRLPVQSGYYGCVRSLVINGRAYGLKGQPHGDAIGGHGIAECGSGGCSGGCLHGGRCVKKCVCPLGYAGDFCEKLLDLQVPRFNGSSFLRYHGLGDSALSWLELQVTLKAGARSGLVMYNAHRSDGVGDFFALYLRDSHAEFVFDLGTGQAIIRSTEKLELEEWYTINVSRTGRLAVLTVVSHDLTSNIDGEDIIETVSSQGLTPGAFTQLSLNQNLYLGGVPQYAIIQKRIGINESFNGCIQKVVINDHEQSIVSSALGGVNIDGCPHACGPDSCGSASCRPRLHHYTCVCGPGVQNEKCTVYLNESSEVHSELVTSAPHHVSKPEHVRYSPLSRFNNSKYTSSVPKKGPKQSIKHHHKNKTPKMETVRQEKPDTFDRWHSYFEPSAKDDIDTEMEKEFQKEWVLSNKEDKHDDEIDSYGNELFVGHAREEVEKKPIYEGRFWMTKEDLSKIQDSEIDTIDSSIEVPRFTGHDSYVRNSDPEVLKRLASHAMDINVRFRSDRAHGLLLWLGKDGMAPGDSFMALGIEDGHLTFRYDVGSGEVIISANQTRVDDGLWHRARAARKGQSGVVDLDGLGAIGKASPGRILPLNTDSGLYIGGMSSIWPETLGRYSSGLEGCVSKLILDREIQVPLSSHHHVSSRNIDKCPP